RRGRARARAETECRGAARGRRGGDRVSRGPEAGSREDPKENAMQGRIGMGRRVERSALRRIAAVALAAALVGGEAGAQLSTDFCGCEGSPNSLGDFHSNDPATWPPGSQQVATGCSPILEIPLPEDGVLIFDSFTVGNMATSGCGT